MSLYIIVMLLLCVGAAYEGYFKRANNEKMYIVMFAIVGLMMCLRYGQGTDYLNYKYMYVTTPSISNFSELLSIKGHGEIGWKFISSICCNWIKLPFEWLAAFISLFELFCINRFISHFCPRKTLALLLLYPTYILTYCFSAFRQGLVICVFLGILLPLFLEKKQKKYFVGVFICCLIHTAALILILIPLLHKIRFGLNSSILYVCFSVVIGMLLKFSGIIDLLPYSGGSVSFPALAERTLAFVVIIIACGPYYARIKKNKENSVFQALMNIYILGFIIYALLFSSDLLASRITAFFKCMEIPLFCIAAQKSEQKGYQLIYTYCIAIATLMTFKNIDSYISQLNYIQSVNVFNYPYVSVFNKEDIAKYARKWQIDYFH